jgi:hypothetical protein
MQAFELSAKVRPDGTIELPQLPIVSLTSAVKVILLVEEPFKTKEDLELSNATESFREGWSDLLAGRTIPVSQLWNGLDDD